MKRGGLKNMDIEKVQEKIILPEKLQVKIFKFFLRTSILRKAKKERMKKALSEKKVQE